MTGVSSRVERCGLGRTWILGCVATVSVLTGCGGSGGGGAGSGCDGHADCRSDEICYVGTCDAAFDRKYWIEIDRVDVGTSFPGGGTWDFGGGAPDLAVCFGFIAQDDACCTSVVNDSFSGVYNEGCSLVIPSGGRFDLEVRDDDATDPDLAAAWYWEGNDALLELAEAMGSKLEVTDVSGTVTVRLTVEPDF